MEDGLVVITDGAGWDCPPERECWFEGPPEHLGRQVRTEKGAIFVFADEEGKE